MQIKQNSETGKIQIYLKTGETPDVEERLEALMNFVFEQSVEIFRLRNSYRKVIEQLNDIEAELSAELQYQLEQRRKQK